METNNSLSHVLFTKLAITRVLIGAAIGLALITIFLSGDIQAKPEWSKYWMIRPFIVVTFAGGAGGFFYHLMESLRRKGKWQMIVANTISLIVFFFGLWIGSVLGLAGTLWD
jgi:hypothetical protein